MSQNKLEAAKSLSQGERVLIEQVIMLALEFWMLFLLQDKDNIPSNCVRLQSKIQLNLHKQIVIQH